MPSASNAALCICGERECSTGHPSTPARRVVPRSRSPTGMREELVVVVREEMPAAVALGDVIEVVHLRRVGGGLKRLQTRVADRAGRQAVAYAGVVRGVGRELRDRELVRPRSLLVEQRGIDAERHVEVQAVVDYGGGQRGVLFGPRPPPPHPPRLLDGRGGAGFCG